MKKLIILAMALLLVFSFCGKKEEAAAEKETVKTAAELFSSTMGNMQKIAAACATLYKKFNVSPQVTSVKELAVELAREVYNQDKDAKPIVTMITGVKSAKELETIEDKENENLLSDLLSRRLGETEMAEYRDKVSKYLSIKLLLNDAWGNEFYIKFENENWWIGSAGSDGRFAGFDQEGDYTHVDQDGNDISAGKDIIFSGAYGFVFGPEVK